MCVPTALDEVVRLFSKAVIREQPDDLLEFGRQWFTTKAAELAAQQAQQALADE